MTLRVLEDWVSVLRGVANRARRKDTKAFIGTWFLAVYDRWKVDPRVPSFGVRCR